MNKENTTTLWHGTLKEYIVGFVLSLLLTLIAYFIVKEHLLKGLLLFSTLGGLGVVQAVIQVFLFLHLGKESKPKWGVVVFLFMLMVLIIIVGGSLWIMQSLDSRLMR